MRLTFIALFVCVVALSSNVQAKTIKPGEHLSSIKTVNGQYKIMGDFGRLWTLEEIEEYAREKCASKGTTLESIDVGAATQKSGAPYIALCL